MVMWYLDSLSSGFASSGLWLLIALIAARLVKLVIRINYTFNLRLLGIVMRKAFSAILYKKLLALSLSAQKASVGRLINMASGDTAIVQKMS